MDIREAKMILHSWRATGADAGDPRFSEALRMAECDPALAEWLAREQALDAALSGKLREVPVPEGLGEDILARHVEVARVPAARKRTLLALAAAIAMVAMIASVWLLTVSGNRGFASYRSRMVGNLAELRLDFAGARLSDVQEWLARNRGLADCRVPEALQGLPTLGCKVWAWRGKPVTLICFSLGQGRVAHLFVVPRASMPDPPDGDQIQFAEVDGWMTANWSEGRDVYLVVRKSDEGSLRRLLNSKA